METLHSGLRWAAFSPDDGEILTYSGDGTMRTWNMVTGALEESVDLVGLVTGPSGVVLRVRTDNWSAHDTSADDECCWTNGYVKVSITR